jgi:Tfp pilus assembly protein PilF
LCLAKASLLLAAICLLGFNGCHIFRSRPVDLRSSMAREMTCDGIDAMQRGRTLEAQGLFAKAAQAAPDDQRIRAELARTLAVNGQLEQAIEQMRHAVALSGGEASYHVELGELYLQTKRLLQAREQADLALNANRRLAGAWSLRGRVEAELGQLEQARTSLHRALAHDHELSDVSFRLAQIYFELDQPQRSLAVLDNLTRRYTADDIPAEYILLDARALADLGQLDQSADRLALVADRPEPDPAILLELSRIHQLRGDLGNAKRTLMRGRELFTARPEFQRRLDEIAQVESETAGLSRW